MVRVSDVRKSFKDTEVLKGISLEIEDGEIYGIIGQSGAGKSTLLRCLNGLESFDSGEIEVLDRKVDPKNRRSLREIQKQMGMIFQSFNLLERLNVFDNVALPMKFWGMDPKLPENKKKILELIRLVGLDGREKAKPRELSGGQKQRVAIARALVLDPKILLCDEATSALDPEITKGILAILQRVNKELGITIIVVTHQMEVVKQICGKVAFLHDGLVLAEGKPEEIFIKPEKKEIRDFLRDSSELLPKTGINIRLFFYGEGSEEPVVTRMARELGRDFSICWARLEDFREKVYGSLVLNIKEEERESVVTFLNRNKVEWEVMN